MYYLIDYNVICLFVSDNIKIYAVMRCICLIFFFLRSGLCKLWSIPDCEPIAVLRGTTLLEMSWVLDNG